MLRSARAEKKSADWSLLRVEVPAMKVVSNGRAVVGTLGVQSTSVAVGSEGRRTTRSSWRVRTMP